MPDKKDIEKLNLLFEFLNDLGSQIVKKHRETSEKNTKELIGELYGLIEDFKNDLAEKIKEGRSDLSKLKIEPSFKLPDIKVYRFPDRIDIPEAADILNLLSAVIKELRVDSEKTEKAITQLQQKLQRGIDDLIFAMPKRMPELPMEKGRVKVTMPEFPMDRGRIAVRLPDDQLQMRTPLGERIKRGITGIFLGGETSNPIVGVRKITGVQINPATEEKQDEIIAAIAVGDGVATTPIIFNVSMALANTEYSQMLPAGTKKVDIKLRATNAQLKIAFVVGESGTKYINIPYGSSLHLENVNLNGVTVYMQSPVASQICEILCFT